MVEASTNNQLRVQLRRVPSEKEEKMIVAYVLNTFKTQVSIIREKKEIEIKDIQKQLEVRKWVKDELDEFLMMDYPDEWEDSLAQHCQKLNLKVSQINQGSKLWQDVTSQFNQKKPNNGQIIQI